MLSYTDLKPGMVFVRDGEPCRVLEYEFVRMQQRKPVAQLKVRSLLSGKTLQLTAYPSDAFEEAEIETADVQFIYANRNEYWFHPAGDPKARFVLAADVIGEPARFLKAGMIARAFSFKNKTISVEVPVKVELTVTEAPPAIKGNTAQGGTKLITLETGAKIATPLFIGEGDIVRVNTETGEYVERVEKG